MPFSTSKSEQLSDGLKSKIVISPAQALLLLIEKHSQNSEVLDKLKKWYISGIVSNEHTQFERYLNDPILERYQVSTDPRVINDDPTRRFFETHLAYETLKNQLKEISKEDLKSHVDKLEKCLPTLEDTEKKNRASAIKLKVCLNALKGEINHQYPNDTIKEYAHFIKKIDDKMLFTELNPEERDKIKLIVFSSFLGVVNAWFRILPLDIYGSGIYSDEQKGKLSLKGQDTTGSLNLGLVKGYMPIPMDDLVRTTIETPFLKPSEQATFKDHAKWVEDNFQLLVHPFSNSISGTMLCQLRNLADFNQNEKYDFISSNAKFMKYIQLFAATMLFGSGGHSLHEFVSPLNVDEIVNEFSPLLDNPVSVYSMFYVENQKAFDNVLDRTIAYNQMILKRKTMMLDINPQMELEKFKENKNKIFQHCLEYKMSDLYTNCQQMDFINQIEANLKGKKDEITANVSINDYNNLVKIIDESLDNIINNEIKIKGLVNLLNDLETSIENKNNNIKKLEKITDLKAILVNTNEDAAERLILAKKEFEHASTQSMFNPNTKNMLPTFFKSIKATLGMDSNEEKIFTKLNDEFKKVKVDSVLIQKKTLSQDVQKNLIDNQSEMKKTLNECRLNDQETITLPSKTF
jgi:hypothetical protein